MNIPVMKPLLPTAEELMPFLQRVDKTRYYSNDGPLVRQLEAGLAGIFDYPRECVACVSSGTMGITAALRAAGAVRGGYCLLPAWTFVAVPAAADAAGLRPYFIDVERDTWALSPERVRDSIPNIDGDVSAIIVVWPFGAPQDAEAWQRLSEETGIPVIFDAAAGFDAVRASPIPTVVSLHATKPFGIGEGGLVLASDLEFMERVRRQRKHSL